MQAIVLDLEWNQPTNFRSGGYRQSGDQLLFEMIQIGAVKLDESRQIVDTFNQLIQPTCYRRLNPHVQKITHKAGGTTEREDVFTFGTNTITETRTLDTGDVLTIVTNTETLATSVTVTAAA